MTTFYTHNELISTFNRVFLSTNPEITKTSPNSVYMSLAAGVAALAQKSLKENALVETYLNPNLATGTRLDEIADQRGIPARQASSTESSVWVRIGANEGAEFTTDHVFTGDHGITFRLEEGFTAGAGGFSYRRLQSIASGLIANVTAFSINRITDPPSGFLFTINETPSFGGREAETDDQFRHRIKNYTNILSFNTISKIGFLANLANPKVFRVLPLGRGDRSQIRLGIITHNGVRLTPDELSFLDGTIRPQVALTDSNLNFENLEPKALEIRARVQLAPNAPSNTVVFNRVQLLIDSFLRGLVYSGEANFLDWVQIYNLIALDPDIVAVSSTDFAPNTPVDLSDRRPLQLTRASFLTLDGRSPLPGDSRALVNLTEEDPPVTFLSPEPATFYDETLDYSTIRNFE